MRTLDRAGTATRRRPGPRRHAVVAALCATVVTGTTACTTAGNAPSAPDAPPARIAELLEQDYAQAATRALPSVVEINTGSGLGSGVVFDDAGHVLTNAHVVGNSTSFQVRLPSGTATYPATLVASWPPDDLAVIKLTGAPPVRPAAFGRSSDLVVGDIVIAMGNPFGLDSSVTEGIVSALGRTVSEPAGSDSPGTVLRDAIQTSAPINPGNSGGALVNLDGEVIGIPTLAAVNPEAGGAAPGIGFAVPSDLATDLARQIVDNGKVVDNAGQPAGVGVAAVQPGGPAANAGIRDGDIITMIDATEVKDAQQLQKALAEHRPGDVVRVTFVRPPGGPTTVPVTLGELPSG
jgi:putative serine protease PepD